jgi:hypothetical protein
MEFGHLSVDISVYLNLKTTDLVMSVISPILFNNKPEFIIIVAERLKICLKRYNFGLSGVIKFGTYLRILGGILRVGYTSTLT